MTLPCRKYTGALQRWRRIGPGNGGRPRLTERHNFGRFGTVMTCVLLGFWRCVIGE